MSDDLRAALRATVRAIVENGTSPVQSFEGGNITVSHESPNHFTIQVTFDNMPLSINMPLADAVVIDMRMLRLPRAPIAQRLATDVQFQYDTYMRQHSKQD